MAWIDRDRTPALFAIMTSVTSSVISFIIGNIFLTGTSRNVLLILVVAVFCGVALVSWVATYAIRRARRRSQRAFLMVSAFEQKYYIASFVQQMNNALDRADIDLVLKVPPDRDYDASAQSHQLDRVLDRRHDYMGGIISAVEVDQLRTELTSFCRTARMPVVFTDVEPFEEAEYPDNSVYVGYNTGQLGKLAGQWMVRHLRGIRNPRVLIIASREHKQRQQEFIRALTKERKDVRIDIDEECAFERSRAYNSVRDYVQKLTSRQCLDAIFCTDDETGLGAVDALAATPSPATTSTVVVGIDGVAEAIALIDSGTSPFRATVVQDTHQLALSIADVLVKVRRGRRLPKRRILEASVYEARR